MRLRRDIADNTALLVSSTERFKRNIGLTVYHRLHSKLVAGHEDSAATLLSTIMAEMKA